MALHPSYTFTTTLSSNIKATLGNKAEGESITPKPINLNNCAVCFATKRVTVSANVPKLTTQSPYITLPKI